MMSIDEKAIIAAIAGFTLFILVFLRDLYNIYNGGDGIVLKLTQGTGEL